MLDSTPRRNMLVLEEAAGGFNHHQTDAVDVTESKTLGLFRRGVWSEFGKT